jgi:hypothetical protein
VRQNRESAVNQRALQERLRELGSQANAISFLLNELRRALPAKARIFAMIIS